MRIESIFYSRQQLGLSQQRSVSHDRRTAGDAENPHDSDDSRVDGNDARFHLFQHDARHRQQYDRNVQLVPPAHHASLSKGCNVFFKQTTRFMLYS